MCFLESRFSLEMNCSYDFIPDEHFYQIGSQPSFPSFVLTLTTAPYPRDPPALWQKESQAACASSPVKIRAWTTQALVSFLALKFWFYDTRTEFETLNHHWEQSGKYAYSAPWKSLGQLRTMISGVLSMCERSASTQTANVSVKS